jgi:predicted metalloprotease with PDZ domain
MWTMRVVVLSVLGGLAVGASGQAKITLYNEQGATAPCLGIGLGLFIVKRCASAFEKQGFVRSKELGDTGLGLGSSPDMDGLIMLVAPGSPAAAAGLRPGDLLVSVDGHPARAVAAEAVAQRAFGPIQNELHLKIKRDGAIQTLTFARIPAAAPPAPKGEGMMTVERPIVNWRGQIAPCMGVPPSQMAAYAFCDSHFKPFGFVKFSDVAATGFGVNPAVTDRAVVGSVQAGSPAMKAGLAVGDEIVEIDGQPVSVSVSEHAKMLLFGKVGEKRLLVYRRGTVEQSATLTLAAKTQADKEEEASAEGR